MTVEEIRKSAEPKHECECGRLKKQIADLEYDLSTMDAANSNLRSGIDKLRTDYDNIMETVDELNDENANLRGQVKALKFAIKQLAKR